MRRILVTMEEGIAGRCRKLHIEELHNFYSSVNSNKVIISRSMR
jgi:hypothetical protein